MPDPLFFWCSMPLETKIWASKNTTKKPLCPRVLCRTPFFLDVRRPWGLKFEPRQTLRKTFMPEGSMPDPLFLLEPSTARALRVASNINHLPFHRLHHIIITSSSHDHKIIVHPSSFIHHCWSSIAHHQRIQNLRVHHRSPSSSIVHHHRSSIVHHQRERLLLSTSSNIDAVNVIPHS